MFMHTDPLCLVPQNRDDRQAIAARSFEIETADAETTVAYYKHDLFSGPCKLSTDGHADAVANGCERAASRIWPGKRA